MKRSHDFNILLDNEEPESTNSTYKRDKLDIVLEKLSNIEVKITSNTNLLGRLTQEIIVTKNGMKKLQGDLETKNLNILPNTPFEDLKQFMEFDSDVKDPAKYAILTNNFRRITASSHMEFVFKCWRVLMKDSVAKNLSWTGTKQKKSVQELSCTAAIKDAFMKKYPAESVDACAQKTKKFFLYANDRLNKIEKYKSKAN
ncbi:uncharacterized protein LOC119610650 isoform X2 [Lucilia sericata]|uniref:uncharacterized protein LOC119601649 isoform X3 n=1 Tax=Lucilia sericata TaxID=13632 RepID=UPI0018A7E9EB|nr:uncharacterized protein LOC119601649 isoform X3 [Lucilia sericata]XP_037808650.1 uncharacterized protein LOC119601649 isoform X3 [Lucilia sericata]XP_037808651.1 uncharacterized protein LOC119601649 isoform X3 [Lucilia sericata]XP_037815515.1 uncharacterized protein LOC119606176 isoform X2 [Lucilia sericata]XP_037815516.1 uncharacterized protein LOC119606176 isoform X2 [Lucilia sericata]XP_037821890.1 uncharacterized protein LOC119610650 isoform X2 [Lucilia sericata]XP_037821891.1 uncharac